MLVSALRMCQQKPQSARVSGDDHSPWLTTSKKRAEEVLHPLRDRYRQALVRSVTISLVVHGNPEEM